MQINTINKYLVEKVDDKNIITIHKMGTTHKESIERFVLNEEKYILMNEKEKNDDKKSSLKMLINPKKNEGSRDNVTYLQYIQLLVFYGLIDFRVIEDIGGFSKISNLISNKELKVEVSNITTTEFDSRVNLISGNIVSQIFSDDKTIVDNAKFLLSTIALFFLLTERGMEINEENLEIILNENNWFIKGKEGTDSKLSQTVRELKNFNSLPFWSETNIFLKICKDIRLP